MSQSDGPNRSTREENARISKSILSVQDQLRAQHEHYANPQNADDFAETLRTVKANFGQITTIQQSSLDSEVVKELSTIVRAQTTKIGESARRINTQSIVRDLLDSFGGKENNQLDFEQLGHESAVFSRSVPALDSLLGCLRTELDEGSKPAVAKAAKREIRAGDGDAEVQEEERSKDLAAVAQETAVENSSSALQEQNRDGFIQYSRLQKEMKNQLQHKVGVSAQPVGLFDFTLDPNSFSKSIENLFALSFFVKDGWAGLRVDPETKEPIVKCTKRPTKADAVIPVPRQAVISFTMKDWSIMKDQARERGDAMRLLVHSGVEENPALSKRRRIHDEGDSAE